MSDELNIPDDVGQRCRYAAEVPFPRAGIERARDNLARAVELFRWLAQHWGS